MKLLIVEDDDALVRSLRDGLASQGFAADAATNAEDAARRLKIDAFDLVVLDLGLPGANGIELLRWLRARDRALPVLVLTARTRVEDRVGGLEAGADDYLTKPFAFAELVARIRALLRRGVTSAPTVLRLGDLEVDPARLEVRRGGKPVPLTVKEFAILEYLLQHAGTLVSRTMLLEHCWDSSYDGLSNLVDVHVSRLRRKLDLAIGPPSLRTVRGAGFVLEG